MARMGQSGGHYGAGTARANHDEVEGRAILRRINEIAMKFVLKLVIQTEKVDNEKA